MRQYYSIGENNPFRLSKDKSAKIMDAMLKTGSTISGNYDSTCPSGYAILLLNIEPEKRSEFEKISGIKVERLELRGGS